MSPPDNTTRIEGGPSRSGLRPAPAQGEAFSDSVESFQRRAFGGVRGGAPILPLPDGSFSTPIGSTPVGSTPVGMRDARMSPCWVNRWRKVRFLINGPPNGTRSRKSLQAPILVVSAPMTLRILMSEKNRSGNGVRECAAEQAATAVCAKLARQRQRRDRARLNAEHDLDRVPRARGDQIPISVAGEQRVGMLVADSLCRTMQGDVAQGRTAAASSKPPCRLGVFHLVHLQRGKLGETA